MNILLHLMHAVSIHPTYAHHLKRTKTSKAALETFKAKQKSRRHSSGGELLGSRERLPASGRTSLGDSGVAYRWKKHTAFSLEYIWFLSMHWLPPPTQD